jgi:hypothetical protein
MTDEYAYHRSYLCVKSYRESRARARPHTKFKRRVLEFHTDTHRVYIPLKPPILIPSDNTALRVRVSTPLQTTVSLRLLTPGSLPGSLANGGDKRRRFGGGRRHRICSSYFFVTVIRANRIWKDTGMKDYTCQWPARGFEEVKHRSSTLLPRLIHKFVWCVCPRWRIWPPWKVAFPFCQRGNDKFDHQLVILQED